MPPMAMLLVSESQQVTPVSVGQEEFTDGTLLVILHIDVITWLKYVF